MKRIWLILFIYHLLLFNPSEGYSQWKFFEHRYSYKLEDVLQATRFVKKKSYWEGYRDNRLVGYVFISKEWTSKLVGYSGKHMETLIGMDTHGVITGVKVLFHSEPIVLIGLKEDNYQKFIKQYEGKDIRSPLSVGKEISMDAITGATVTAVVENATILGSARKVAAEAGIITIAKKAKRKVSEKFTPMSMEELLKSGAIRNIGVTSKELGIEDEEIYLDLYFGIATPPSIGRNILGDNIYKEAIADLKEGETAIIIFARGKGSFKGSGFARGGVFDRFNIEQDARVYVFRDRDYNILTDIRAKGAPSIKEGGVFIIRDKEFDPAMPFKFNLTLPYRVGVRKEFKAFSAEYKIPEGLFE